MESLDEADAGGDENRAHDQRAQNSPEQDLVLVDRGGTWKKRKIRRKTKRLSTLKESSMTYPVTNSSAGVRPCQKKINDGKNRGQGDPGHAPDQGLAELYGVGAAVEHAQVEHQHGEHEKIK